MTNELICVAPARCRHCGAPIALHQANDVESCEYAVEMEQQVRQPTDPAVDFSRVLSAMPRSSRKYWRLAQLIEDLRNAAA